jgi:hypothetical protein
MLQPFALRPESAIAMLIATTELRPPMSDEGLDMSLSTPILTVLSSAHAEVAEANVVKIVSAAVPHANVLVIVSPPLTRRQPLQCGV